MRKPFIAGNWKMHKTPNESIVLAKEIDDYLKENKEIDVDVLVCPPYTSLYAINNELKNRKIYIGAQNMNYKKKKEITREISTQKIKEMKVEYIILKHT